MKKILVTLSLLLAFVGSSFALDLQIGADLTMPLQIQKNEIVDKTAVTTNFGIDLNADYFFTDLIGVGADISFVIPLKMHCDGASAKVRSDVYKPTCFDFFAGCALRVLNKDNMQLIVTPGFDFGLSFVKYDYGYMDGKYTLTTMGLGADTKFAYKFNDKFGINAGAYLGYNFHEKQKEEGIGLTHNPKMFVFTPKVGATYFF